MGDQNSVCYATPLLVAGLLLRSLFFDPRPGHVGFLRGKLVLCLLMLTFRHRASCILGQAFHYSPENVFYIFYQQIYFII